MRIGLPQDFFDDVMPATLACFGERHDAVHVEVCAGENHRIAEEIKAGRLDTAIAFYKSGSSMEGELLFELPMIWLAHETWRDRILDPQAIPLVLFSHPCLFRQAALAALERQGIRWRAALTTPSLPGVWASLRSGLGIAVRTEHGRPPDMVSLREELGLPELPAIELRLLRAPNISPIAASLADILRQETLEHVGPNEAG